MAAEAPSTTETVADEITELRDLVETLQESLHDAKREQAEDRQRIAALEAENEELRERVAALERQDTPNPASKDYEEKTRDEKVHELRVALARKADSNGGKAAMDYNDVLSLFNQHPSPGHAYKLMKIAADYDEETGESHYDGYHFDKHTMDQQRLLVNLGGVNDDAVFHAVNNESTSEGVK